MAHPVAIAFIHGIGRTQPGYANALRIAILRRFQESAAAPADQLHFKEINWSGALQRREDRLWTRLRAGVDGALRFSRLRHFMVDFAADAIAYQPAPSDRTTYDAVHTEVACALTSLASRAGPRAPLCIVAHSLGTVIASNYLYDLGKPRRSFLAPEVRTCIGCTPLERGETLALLVTLGSPIALWSLRYPGNGVPITFPPRRLKRHHPAIEARWINAFDRDDVIGYPLRPLNQRYGRTVTEDRLVDVGSWLTRWTPLSHMGYWGSRSLAASLADSIVEIWMRGSALGLVDPERAGSKAAAAGERRSRRRSNPRTVQR